MKLIITQGKNSMGEEPFVFKESIGSPEFPKDPWHRIHCNIRNCNSCTHRFDCYTWADEIVFTAFSLAEKIALEVNKSV